MPSTNSSAFKRLLPKFEIKAYCADIPRSLVNCELSWGLGGVFIIGRWDYYPYAHTAGANVVSDIEAVKWAL